MQVGKRSLRGIHPAPFCEKSHICFHYKGYGTESRSVRELAITGKIKIIVFIQLKSIQTGDRKIIREPDRSIPCHIQVRIQLVNYELSILSVRKIAGQHIY